MNQELKNKEGVREEYNKLKREVDSMLEIKPVYTYSQLFYALALSLGDTDSPTFAELDPGFRIQLPENRFDASALVLAAGVYSGNSSACDTLEMILKEGN